MKILNLPGLSKLKSIFSRRTESVPSPEELPQDTVTVRPLEDAREALTHKPGSLTRPVVLVNGLARNAHEWDKMVPWLTSNPENRFGGIYQQGHDQEFQQELQRDPGAQVFVFNPSNNLASPRVLAGELQRMIDHIVRATGAEKIDILGHSQGGLDILAAVDQGETHIGKAISFATPWEGAAVASLARTFDGMEGKKGEKLLAPLGHDQGALFDIRPLERNPWLQGAHSRLSENAHAPEFHSLSGSGTPTPGGKRGGSLVAGDGFVSIESGLGLPGASNYHLPPGDWAPGDKHFRAFNLMDVNHLGIVSNSAAFKTLGQILTTPDKNASEAAETSEALPRSATESLLDTGSQLIHAHVRQSNQVSLEPFYPLLNRTQELRQEQVESEMRTRAAELKKTRARWVTGLGTAAAVAGLAAAGPLAAIPGALAAGVGLVNFGLSKLREHRVARESSRLQNEARQLKDEIVSQVSSPPEDGGLLPAPAPQTKPVLLEPAHSGAAHESLAPPASPQVTP